MNQLGDMTAFAKVVETGSFTAAARQLRLSSTMVSKHVRELEDRLGLKLLNRTTRRVSLTEVGALYYERCAPLLAEIAELECMASQMNTTPRGLLRVSAPLAFGAARVAPALADFSKHYPDVTVELILTDRVVDLVEEGFDLAVRFGDPGNSSLITRQLAIYPTMVCATPAYLAEHGIPATPEDLARHNCLTQTTEQFSRQWTFLGPDGRSHAVRISGNFRTNSISAQLAAALRGQGLTLQPSHVVADEIISGRLAQVLAAFRAPELVARVVYLPGRHLSAKTRAFIDFFVAQLAEQP